MFFSLNLIESYGSGVRRAKDALLQNGSPNLKFYPDNEVDDYTNAIMGVNSEFMLNASGSITKETTKEINSVSEQIINFMKKNPTITAEQIAGAMNDITADGVRYHIKNLKRQGTITREGSTRSGRWIVIEQG